MGEIGVVGERQEDLDRLRLDKDRLQNPDNRRRI